MLRHLIIYLIRKKLRLRKHQRFRFANQKSPTDCYYFTSDTLMKESVNGYRHASRASLTWLLSDECCVIADVK